MCGIAGFTTLDHPVEHGRITGVISTIHHRGPDGAGVHESGCVALGNARLSIIDVDAGHQPMYAAGGDIVIVYNGEIYNHAELRTELESLGHRFETRCDTEVVLKGFVEWDMACFSRLRGMFAIAIWTESTKRLVLVRDRMGIKPLYIYHRGRDIYFGSELKTLFAHPEIPRQLDLTGLGYYLSLNYVPAPYTLVDGIEKLGAGEMLEWRTGEIERNPYWNLRLAPQHWTADDAKARLDELLALSVREHLISDVPLGVWASGGLDSSTVLHYAAREVSRLKTFSISFKGHSHDESEYFRRVAAQYGTDHHEFDLNPEVDLADTVQKLVDYSDEPSADAGALPVWYLSMLTRRHVTVALSGEGADELFGGYLTYRADHLYHEANRIPAWMRRTGLSLLGLWPVSDGKISLEYKAKRFLEGSLLKPASAHLFWNGTFNMASKRELLGFARQSDPGSLMNTLPTEAFSCGDVNRFLWLDQKYYLADDILNKCDRMSMAHSLEVRPPFLDHRIVEFAASLPEDLKVRGKTLKFILRDLMRGKLPETVLTRPKEGFDIPAHRWFRGPLKPLLDEAVSERAVNETGVLQWQAVERIKSEHQRRRASHGYGLWGMLILFLWMRRWKIECAATR
ncbi:MAG TPA: asparagine synthase (glutamine-hydrolyzing) [Bryobacteraceae bacterium]|nr:asparagine synthase (glutamine-hydrolyzing) [Bryobacteraceae bacterium]